MNQRLGRWLLTAADRAATDELNLTEEFLAQMIGAPRPAVAETLSQMPGIRVLAGQDGPVTLHDRPAVEATACECYRIGVQEMDIFLRGLACRS